MNPDGSIAELDAQFGIRDIATIVEGNGGLAKVRITCAEAEGEMYLHGGHVTSWKPRGAEEALFVSTQSRWENGRAIRGGVPICFPWFGDNADNPNAPAHGFVRIKAWQLDSIERSRDAVTISMFTESDADTKKWWSADFHLRHRVRFGSELSMELVLTNKGSVPLRFEEALHTYLRVGDIDKASLSGLHTVPYLDKADSNKEKKQNGEIGIGSEIDRVYLNTQNALELKDDALHRRIRVAKENSLTTVVWNPWVQEAKSLADFGDDEWKRMICIECSNVANYAVNLAAGQQHIMKAILQVAAK